MRYPEFRQKGLLVGSGVIEARCKSVVGVRLKRSGMFWTVRAANAIIALRCFFTAVRRVQGVLSLAKKYSASPFS